MIGLSIIPYQLNPYTIFLGLIPWSLTTVAFNLPTFFLVAAYTPCSERMNSYADTLPDYKIDDFLDNCNDYETLVSMGYKTPDMVLAFNEMDRDQWVGTKEQ